MRRNATKTGADGGKCKFVLEVAVESCQYFSYVFSLVPCLLRRLGMEDLHVNMSTKNFAKVSVEGETLSHTPLVLCVEFFFSSLAT